MPAQETIAAVATAPGHGGIGIVRLSGKGALAIAQSVTGRQLEPRHAHFCSFRGERERVLDTGIALFFPAPHSFTGEDVVELQGHGGPVVLDMLLREVCRRGARPANPGEFSQRAFLNNRIDLAQAEAIADLIASATDKAALNATQTLQGAFSREIETLVRAVTELRVYIEAAIDFPEEEIDYLAEGRVDARLRTIVEQFEAVMLEARRGRLVREGIKLVIAGRPNAGKSSLLNALAGQDAAIVTAIEGTTRDLLREHIQIDGVPMHVVDTAGLRASGDEIEREGIRRAWREMRTADRILLVVDSAILAATGADPGNLWPESGDDLPRNVPVTLILNKSDLIDAPPEIDTAAFDAVFELSATTGQGMKDLREHLSGSRRGDARTEGGFSARQRHLRALEQALEHLCDGQQQLAQTGAGELLAEDLRQCQHCLGEITGAVSSDALLGEIFSSFCIGK